MRAVKSSNLAAIGFDPYEGSDVGTMTVSFRNGRVYAYLSVPSERYDALMAEAARVDPDASVGKLFNKLVRSQGFECEEVSESADSTDA